MVEAKELDRKDIPTLIEQGPDFFVASRKFDRVAKACIKDDVLLASGTSALQVYLEWDCGDHYPTDAAQFYAFSLKLAQELGIFTDLMIFGHRAMS